MNKEDVIHGLKTLAKQERKAQSLLTGPREAPQEFERWYIAEVLESAVLIIEQRDWLADALEHLATRGGQHQPVLQDTVANIASKALAAVEGGQP
jgi:type II secretory pathway component PulL